MQYDVTTPAEYMAALEDDWRRRSLEDLRKMIKKLIKQQAPGLKEGIEYKMLRFGDSNRAVLHLNAQKNYVSLYVGDANKIDPGGELLAGLDQGKGCIRFKKSVKVTDTRIEEFLVRLFKLWKSGKDIGC